MASDAAGNNNTAAIQATQVFDSRTSIELSNIAADKGGFVIIGENANDSSGYSVSFAGDVNGDGFDDLIIGAPYATANGDTMAGKSYVVFGGTDINSLIKLSEIADGTGGFVITGANSFEVSGFSVSSAGDVNGDGLDDLIIGAYAASSSGIQSGSSYIVFGQTENINPVSLSQVATGMGGFVIHGVAEYENSGTSVSSAGDLNGDGLDDLIIGALGAAPNGTNSGCSYVVFGKDVYNSPIQLSDIADSNDGFVIHGEAAGDYSGWSVSGAGDVNGDGLDDLIIGAYLADPNDVGAAGKSYVVFGKKENNSPIKLSEIAGGNGGFVIHGEAENDYSGYSVSFAGDVNGDGFDDLIIGAHGADPNGTVKAGNSYVVFGQKENNSPVQLSDIADGDGGFVIHGEAETLSGRSVSGAGDINGDGLADLIIGAYGADSNGTSSGSSYVVFGKKDNSNPIQLSNIADGVGGFVIHGEAESNYSGWSVSGAGDINSDGLGDLIIGAWGADPNGNTQAGSSYVIL